MAVALARVMRLHWLLVLLAITTTIASAQPAPPPIHVDVSVDVEPPGIAPPLEPRSEPPAQSVLEIAAHLGIARTTETYSYFGMYDQTGPRATNLVFDASAGVRLRPWLSLAGFGALSSISDVNVQDAEFVSYAVTNRIIDLGGRVRFHLSGAFVGALAGLEVIRASYAWGDATDSRWYSGALVGIEAGYRGERHAGVAPELVLALTHTFVADGNDVFPNAMMSAELTSARASVGLVF